MTGALTGQCHCRRIGWSMATMPSSATACSCTICRRYGALWAYGHVGHDIHVSGEAIAYRRADGGSIDFFHCPDCLCTTHYISTTADGDGRHWTGVNLRMCAPEDVAALPIDHFDGLDSWDDLPRDGRCVGDMWF